MKEFYITGCGISLPDCITQARIDHGAACSELDSKSLPSTAYL